LGRESLNIKLDAKGANLNRKEPAFILAIILACIIVGQVRAQQATISVVPASYTVPTVGTSFTVNVTVQNVEDLYGWALQLYYPNSVLNGTSVTEGAFLKTGGYQTVFIDVNFTDNYNATYGVANLLCTREGNVLGASGSGTLTTITFKSISTGGPQTLHLADIGLSNSNLGAIPFSQVDGEVTVVPEFPTILILPLFVALTMAAVVLRKKSK
jgi:hypothetical protein